MADHGWVLVNVAHKVPVVNHSIAAVPPSEDEANPAPVMDPNEKPPSSSSSRGIDSRTKDEAYTMNLNIQPLDASVDASSPFAMREGQFLFFQQVNLSVTVAGQTKQILHDVWGRAPSGNVTAIMGPSGSGKTSLLNVLSGRVSANTKLMTVQADVRLNHTPVDPSHVKIRQRIAFVAQDDSLQVTATPREAILFSARLRLPKTKTMDELVGLTERMVHELHLQECADTLIGGALVKGVSGGERKRTSVGVELVTQPSLVFLDEPTSGLDSFNALELMQVLKRVAIAGSSVLCTIHQPSSEIFNALDNLLLLDRGMVMYEGPVSDVCDYFGQKSFKVPNHYNPADFIMTIAQTVPRETLIENGFFGPHKDQPSVHVDKRNSSIANLPDHKVGFPVQVSLLFRRELYNLKRNKKALAARTGMTIMISTLGGIIFYQVGKSDFNSFINVQSTFGGLLLALLANVFSTALPSLVAFPEERPVFLREYSTNHYSVAAYFVSRLAMELLVTACQVTVSSILTYFLMGLTPSFGIFWSTLYVMAMTSTALGVLLGCSVKDPGVAIEFLPLVFMPQILFAGFFIPPDLIPVWLRWLSYIFPLTYAVKIVVIAEFDGNCQGDPVNFCDQVMENINANPEDTWWYWLILLGQFVFFRLLALFILRRKASRFY